MAFLKKLLFIVLLIIFILLGIWFAEENQQEISMMFFGFEGLLLPKSAWVLLSLLAGCALGIISSYPIVFSLKKQIRTLKKQLTKEKQKASKDESLNQSK